MNHLQEMIDKLEREAFETWVITEKYAFRDEKGELHFQVGDWRQLSHARLGRAALRSPCRGVAHPNCNYLAVCGSICNKCGQST